MQWNNESTTNAEIRPSKIINEDLNIDTGQISVEEIIIIIKRLQKNNAPGPDRTTAELYKYLNNDNIEIIAWLLNIIWALDAVPEELTEANVASIFKKGDTKNLANYRPSSLLNTLYNIYASTIHNRIASKIDDHINNTQYGFRKKRSTAHAFDLARRIQDLAEQSGENIVMVLLDWGKAFDKSDQGRMFEALRRFNIPSQNRANIEAIYGIRN